MSNSPFYSVDQLIETIGNATAHGTDQRIEAISQLGDQLTRLTDPRGFLCLMEVVKADGDVSVVIHATSVLSRVNAVSCIETFMDIALGTGILLFDGAESVEFKESDDGIRLRTTAIRALGRLKDSRAIAPLMSILNDRMENYRLRLAAAESLGRIGDAHAVRPLLDIISDEREKSAYLKESAVKALGMLGDLRAMESLIDEMESKKGFWNKFNFLKEHLFEAIGRVGRKTDKINDSLLRALQDEASSIRMAAVEALGAVGDVAAIPHLHQMLFDTNDEVAMAAVEAIYAIGGEEGLKELLHLENLPKILREAVFDYFLEDAEESDEEGGGIDGDELPPGDRPSW